MAKKKRAASTKSKTGSVRLRSRRNSSKTGLVGARTIGHYIVPLMITAILLASVVFIGISGYETATASNFFELKYVDVRGTDRTAPDDVKRIVSAAVEKPGVWHADLSDIRAKIEKFPFVKSASVSRSLPSGIRVNVVERVPGAIVRMGEKNVLVDGEGIVLSTVGPDQEEFPFVLHGWDESKTEKAIPENLARLKIYRKMLEEWRQFDLASRVKEVNLANPREPVAVVEDSGRPIAVTLAREKLGNSLKTAVEALSGKGSKIKSVDSGGVYPVIQYLEY
ncbi:MAG: cell division protein FtsQ/DivIB [Pyrinomonadaceae bacterium]